MSKLSDERKKIVDSICSRLEKGDIPWKADWECFSQTPLNAVSGVRYKGGNSFRLSFIAAEKGYTDNRWCTFLQAQEKGWKIKVGSKSCSIEFFSLPKEEDIEKAKAGEYVPKEKLRPIAKLYNVFNAEDIDGIPPLAVKKSDSIEQIEKAERILQESGAVIKYQGDMAFYRPSTDEIVLPPKELFHSTEGFYSTALHELGHWTGHESRLNRFSQDVKLKEDRAKEELRAELASVFVGSETGIKQDEGHFENHVAYLGSWLKALRNDPNELFRAANEADKISEFILQHERKRERENIVEIKTKEASIDIPNESENSDKNYRSEIRSDGEVTKMKSTEIEALKEASQKHLEYMKSISEVSGIVITDDVKQNSKATSNWIKTGLEYCDKNGIAIDSSKQQDFMQILSKNTARAIPEEAFYNSKEASKWIKENLDILDKHNVNFATEKQIILIEAKATLGFQAFVTNAENSATYEGKIVASSENYAVQEVSNGKGILHSLEKNPVLKDLVESENLDKSVRISYDKERQASIDNISDFERKASMAIDEENEY